MTTEIKVGGCGFTGGQRNYFSQFKLVEIQQTFYQLPRLPAAGKWRAAAPKDFEFTLKPWQLLTHEAASPTYRRLGEKIDPARLDRYGSFRPTSEVTTVWRRTADFACALGATLVVFQCPASFEPTPERTDNLKKFFATIDRSPLRMYVSTSELLGG